MTSTLLQLVLVTACLIPGRGQFRVYAAAGGLFGARITGGGSGGTVAIVGRADAGPAIARVAQNYERVIGYRPYVFAGSSGGASSFGSLTLNIA